MKICIQAGHQNVKYNSIVELRGSTGAPNELEFNINIRDLVSDELRKRGFEVTGVDANANDDPNITGKDWDLFLAIHYDADVYGKGGGFVDYPEPSTDGATAESQRIVSAIRDEYFKTTGITNVYQRSNKNTRYYYMWRYLSAKTPCALIECGVGMHVPDDWETLHFNRPRVVEGIVRGVCKAFNQPYDTTPPQPQPDPCAETKAQNEQLTAQNTKLTAENSRLTAKLSEVEAASGALRKENDGLVETNRENSILIAQMRTGDTEWDATKKAYNVSSFTDLDAIIRKLKEELAVSQTSASEQAALKQCKLDLSAAKKESVKTVSKTRLIQEYFNRLLPKKG